MRDLASWMVYGRSFYFHSLVSLPTLKHFLLLPHSLLLCVAYLSIRSKGMPSPSSHRESDRGPRSGIRSGVEPDRPCRLRLLQQGCQHRSRSPLPPLCPSLSLVRISRNWPRLKTTSQWLLCEVGKPSSEGRIQMKDVPGHGVSRLVLPTD